MTDPADPAPLSSHPAELPTEAVARRLLAAWHDHPAEVRGCLGCGCPWFAHHSAGCVGCDRCPGYRPGPPTARD